jgi:hypothetical protein
MKLRQVSPTEWEIRREGGMRVPGRVFASEALLVKAKEDQATKQVGNVAHLPGIVDASMAMPDIHWGYGFPIGGVAATDVTAGGVVSPGGVGFDICCGVRLLASTFTAADFRAASAKDRSPPLGCSRRCCATVPPRFSLQDMATMVTWTDAKSAARRQGPTHRTSVSAPERGVEGNSGHSVAAITFSRFRWSTRFTTTPPHVHLVWRPGWSS